VKDIGKICFRAGYKEHRQIRAHDLLEDLYAATADSALEDFLLGNDVLIHFTILHNSFAVSSYQIANLFLERRGEGNCDSVNIGG